jgi:hypothetical protein
LETNANGKQTIDMATSRQRAKKTMPALLPIPNKANPQSGVHVKKYDSKYTKPHPYDTE